MIAGLGWRLWGTRWGLNLLGVGVVQPLLGLMVALELLRAVAGRRPG